VRFIVRQYSDQAIAHQCLKGACQVTMSLKKLFSLSDQELSRGV
jgi:hypothetical protein